jgi:hypothetical protein
MQYVSKYLRWKKHGGGTQENEQEILMLLLAATSPMEIYAMDSALCRGEQVRNRGFRKMDRRDNFMLTICAVSKASGRRCSSHLKPLAEGLVASDPHLEGLNELSEFQGLPHRPESGRHSAEYLPDNASL